MIIAKTKILPRMQESIKYSVNNCLAVSCKEYYSGIPWKIILPLLEMFSVFVLDINGNPVSSEKDIEAVKTFLAEDNTLYFPLGSQDMSIKPVRPVSSVKEELQIRWKSDYAIGKGDRVKIIKIEKIAVV